jgi:hypothetical protein
MYDGSFDGDNKEDAKEQIDINDLIVFSRDIHPEFHLSTPKTNDPIDKIRKICSTL